MWMGVESVIMKSFHSSLWTDSSLHLLLTLVGVRISNRSHLCGFAAASAHILEKAEVGTSTHNHSDDYYDGGTKGGWDWILQYRVKPTAIWSSLGGQRHVRSACAVTWGGEDDGVGEVRSRRKGPWEVVNGSQDTEIGNESILCVLFKSRLESMGLVEIFVTLTSW